MVAIGEDCTGKSVQVGAPIAMKIQVVPPSIVLSFSFVSLHPLAHIKRASLPTLDSLFFLIFQFPNSFLPNIAGPMHSLSLLLTFILTFIALAHACHHPSHPVACSLSLKRAKITANSTHLIIQGTTTQSTRCKTKRSDEAALGSVIHVFTKETAHIKDGQGHGHTGNDCQINVPYTLPTLEKAETTKVILPLEKDVKIHCERRRFKSQQQKPHTSSSSATLKKSAPTPTTKEKPTTTTTTTKEKPTTTKEKPTTTKEKPTTTKKHHPKPTTTKEKDPKPTHGSDNDDWDYDDGQVTFFTPNQGACGEWNDDNDFIAALGGDLYGDMDEESKLCGKKILIQGPKGNEITVTVRDACPPCDADHIDLSPAAFAKLGKFDTGILKVKWKFL